MCPASSGSSSLSPAPYRNVGCQASRYRLHPTLAVGVPHLAAATAESVAAHGVVSQGAFLAAVPARPAALLRDAGIRGGRWLSLDLPHPDLLRRAPVRHLAPHPSLTCTEPQSHSSPASTKPFPHSGGSKSWTGKRCLESGRGLAQASLPHRRPRAGTLRGLLKRQLPPPSCRNWLYSSMLQRENLRGR